MFSTSEATDKIDEALAKAQAEIENAPKDKDNPFFKSKYADLASVVKASRTALTKHGISVSQWPLHSDDNRMHLVTRLACAGQWMKSEFSLPMSKQDPQGYVSAVTYGKRCALAAAVGVAADDEDDDGNTASGKHEPPAAKNGKNGHNRLPPKEKPVEPPAEIESFSELVKRCQSITAADYKPVAATIKNHPDLSHAERDILWGICVIRRIHIDLGGKEETLFAAARGAALQSTGEKLDWTEAAIKHDTRFTDEQREELLEKVAERRENLAKNGAA